MPWDVRSGMEVLKGGQEKGRKGPEKGVTKGLFRKFSKSSES